MGDGRGDPFEVVAQLNGLRLRQRDIRDEELERARHALAYLKSRIGDASMLDLLASDIDLMTRRVAKWVEASEGRWQTDFAELIVPGPSAASFHQWYNEAMGERREAMLRAGHPEHFVLRPSDAGIEVIENVGETDLPWHVHYRPLPDDAFPLPWDAHYPVRFGAELVDRDGTRVGYTMHQSRDADDGMHLRLRTLLPEAAPRSLVDRHLRHFAIEFTNWTCAAWHEDERTSS